MDYSYLVYMHSTPLISFIARFKLHFWPKFLPSEGSSRSLPANKQAVDVLADYLRYLYTCSLLYLEKTHVHGWDSVDVKEAQLIFSYPNGWDGMQDQIRKAAVMSNIIVNNNSDHSRISFVTEAEANLYFVLKHGPPQQLVEVGLIPLYTNIIC